MLIFMITTKEVVGRGISALFCPWAYNAVKMALGMERM